MNAPRILLALTAACFLVGRAAALIPIPSDGSDGNFNPATSVEIDLSQAITGAWDTSNASDAGKGRYDPTKWAVVFKYASVNIPAGVTVTFKNHPTYAPVMWLVSGSVTISGTVSVAGKNGTADNILRLTPPEPGPGGFRGGPLGPSGRGAGLGPGGGQSGTLADQPGLYATIYGNPQIIPLIGGSGGGPSIGAQSAGAGGGGAILIAAAGTVLINGLVDAQGGVAAAGNIDHGSGGAIRLIAEQISGSGQLNATNPGSANIAGRIRLETYSFANTIQRFPDTIAVPPASTPIIFPGANAPTARIASVSSINAPVDPMAPLGSSADVGIETNAAVNVVIETTNFPISGTVQLRVATKFGTFTLVNATYTAGNFSSATWTVSRAFTPGFSTLQAIATAP